MVPTDGFVRLPNWLIDDADLGLHELAVYIVLLRFRDSKTGKCFPGMTTIADRARMSRRTVIRAIEKLEERKMIRVTRRSSLKVNQANVYEVALASEKPEFVWADSARGRRIPTRRRPDDSESSGEEVAFRPSDSESPPSDSESLPSDSESPPPVTPSHPNKIQGTRSKDKIQEKASTHTQKRASEFSFEIEGNQASNKQVAYLKDLAIHLSYGGKGGTPDELQIQRWRKLTRSEATAQIRGYLRALGRPDDLHYPEYGTSEYEALSDAGKEFADTAGMPDSVFEYGFGMKENQTA